MNNRPIQASALLGLLHAALFALAFVPGAAWWPVVFLAPAPLIWIGLASPRPLASALVAGAASIPAWALHHLWLIDVTIAGYPLLSVYLALYPALFVWVTARLSRGRGIQAPAALFVFIPVLWVGLETLRGLIVLSGYPWYLLAHPAIAAEGYAMLASVIGTFGVSLISAVISTLIGVGGLGLLDDGPRERLRKWLPAMIAAPLLFAAGHFGGASLRSAPPAGQHDWTIAVIQTNVPQDNKIGWTPERQLRDFAEFVDLTRAAAAQSPRPDLIVWPETMFPGLSLNAEAVAAEAAADLALTVNGSPFSTLLFHDELMALQAEIGVPMLVGAHARIGLRFEPDVEGRIRIEQDASHNSAFVLAGGQVLDQRADKIHLTPFGEVMPIISRFDWLEARLLALGAPGMSFDLAPGAGPVALEIPAAQGGDPLRVGTPICFEATMPGVCRRLVYDGPRRRADALINLTNDGWFNVYDIGRRQHLTIARWRCIELGTPMIRAANTGISCLIDARGRVTQAGPNSRKDPAEAETPARVAGVMTVTLPVVNPEQATAYARVGDLAGWGCLALSLAGAAPAVIRKRSAGAS